MGCRNIKGGGCRCQRVPKRVPGGVSKVAPMEVLLSAERGSHGVPLWRSGGSTDGVPLWRSV